MIAFASILYFPEENALINIKKASEKGFKSIVYLNKVEPIFLEKLKQLDVVILGGNSNVGIGKAFYDIEKYLEKECIPFFVYFDQDTVVNDCAWMSIKETYKCSFDDLKTGMVFYTSSDVNKFNKGIVISSGCLFSMKILNEIGFHDKSYFVEGVDYELCLRLKIHHYDINSRKIDAIDHLSLQDSQNVNIFGKKLNLRVYGKSRKSDFNRSQIKLLNVSLRCGFLKMSSFFVKSILVFNINEFISNILIKNEKN